MILGGIMEEKILRKLFLGFIQLHILRHGSKKPIYGVWLMDHLKEHGYNMSSGTIYPLLKNMCKDELLSLEEKKVEGKIRKYYTTTDLGKIVLKKGEEKVSELSKNM